VNLHPEKDQTDWSRTVIPKVGRTGPWGGALRGKEAARGRSGVLTIEVTLDQTLGNWLVIKPVPRIKNLLTVKSYFTVIIFLSELCKLLF
jgi:hypothetical protein